MRVLEKKAKSKLSFTGSMPHCSCSELYTMREESLEPLPLSKLASHKLARDGMDINMGSHMLCAIVFPAHLCLFTLASVLILHASGQHWCGAWAGALVSSLATGKEAPTMAFHRTETGVTQDWPNQLHSSIKPRPFPFRRQPTKAQTTNRHMYPNSLSGCPSNSISVTTIGSREDIFTCYYPNESIWNEKPVLAIFQVFSFSPSIFSLPVQSTVGESMVFGDPILQKLYLNKMCAYYYMLNDIYATFEWNSMSCGNWIKQ